MINRSPINSSPVANSVPYDNSVLSILPSDVQGAITYLYGLSSISAAGGTFGDGSDGNISLNSGITTLSRTMYYNNLTLSGTAILSTNGFKIFVLGTLTLSGSASIVRIPNNGGNATGQTAGVGGSALIANDMGAGLAGQNGVNGVNGGLGGASGVPGIAAGSAVGYGGAGGAGGTSGSGTGGAAGTYTHVPERVVRQDHIYLLAYKLGGLGGASGGAGPSPALGTSGASGGAGSGGGVVMIFATNFNNTSSIGITAKGGNGGNGGNATGGAAAGGSGSGGGGGGMVYVVSLEIINLGTINVSGGIGGTGGSGLGAGSAGGSGSNGSAGHYSVFYANTNTWLFT